MTFPFRPLRRPLILGCFSLVCLVVQHALLVRMAHGHVARRLLVSGGTGDGAALAIALLVVRFIAYILVPGLLLAAGAEIVAYLLVGPKRAR